MSTETTSFTSSGDLLLRRRFTPTPPKQPLRRGRARRNLFFDLQFIDYLVTLGMTLSGRVNKVTLGGGLHGTTYCYGLGFVLTLNGDFRGVEALSSTEAPLEWPGYISSLLTGQKEPVAERPCGMCAATTARTVHAGWKTVGAPR